jgi:hypothetical protein
LAKGHKKAGGRPKRDMDRFAFFFSNSDREVLETLAQREGLNLADMVRRSIREFVERETSKDAKLRKEEKENFHG